MVTHVRPIDTLICEIKKFSRKQRPTTNEDKEMTRGKSFAQIVGSIMYAMLCTKPDLSFFMCLSKFLSNPGLSQWHAVKRILRYIKGTLKLHLGYQGDHLELCSYSDAD